MTSVLSAIKDDPNPKKYKLVSPSCYSPHRLRAVHWIRDCASSAVHSLWRQAIIYFNIPPDCIHHSYNLHGTWWCLLRWSDVKAKAKSQIGSKLSNGRWNLPEFLPTLLWRSHQSRLITFCANAIVSVVGIQNSSQTDSSLASFWMYIVHRSIRFSDITQEWLSHWYWSHTIPEIGV